MSPCSLLHASPPSSAMSHSPPLFPHRVLLISWVLTPRVYLIQSIWLWHTQVPHIFPLNLAHFHTLLPCLPSQQ